MSPVFNFTTPLPAGDKTPFKFVVYGDMGLDGYPEATTTAVHMRQEVEENDIRFIYHHGDISYARGQVTTNLFRKHLQLFLNFYLSLYKFFIFQ